MRAIWGDKVAASLLDDDLARMRFKRQQRPERFNPDRKDKLFELVAGDHGAHGSFDHEAGESSAALSISEHKKELGLAALGAAAAARGVGFMLASRSCNGDSSRRGKTSANQRS